MLRIIGNYYEDNAIIQVVKEINHFHCGEDRWRAFPNQARRKNLPLSPVS
jgi:hypothetical protein